ncbi:hypothetical protein ACO0QE_002702 [Hanseniaspora vineae]
MTDLDTIYGKKTEDNNAVTCAENDQSNTKIADLKSPLADLFPSTNNIALKNNNDYATNGKKHKRSFASLTSNDAESGSYDNSEDLESFGDSLNTNVIKEIVATHSPSQLRENLVNNRYWLSNLYDSKAQQQGGENSSGSLSNCKDDFLEYNKKVTREYQLREKLDMVLKNRGNVQVLNNEGLIHLYKPETQQTLERNSFLPTGSNWKHPLKFFQRKALSKKGRNSPQKEHHLSSVTSTSNGTEIIDNRLSPWNIDNQLYNHRADDYMYDNSSNVTEMFEQSKPAADVDFKHVFHDWAKSHNQNYVRQGLTVNQLTMIAVGECLGVGLFVFSGRLFYVGGPLGVLIGFAGCGSVVISTLLSFSELSSFIPLSSGFSGLASRFVSDAIGFSIGWCYWLSYAMSLPSETVVSATILQAFFPETQSTKVAVISVTLIIILTLLVNLLGIRYFGQIITVTSSIKVIITIILIIVMIVLNTGAATNSYVGFRYWDSSKSQRPYEHYGPFRPTFNLKNFSIGSVHSPEGISGSMGRFLSVIFSIVGSVFAFSGCEMSFVANSEAINPRNSLPSAIKKTFILIIILYMVSIFVVGLNVYSGDPRLHLYYKPSQETLDYVSHSRFKDSCQKNLRILNMMSPWVLALQNFGYCTFAKGFDAVLFFFGWSTGCCALFASSRALYTLSIQNKAPAIFTVCNTHGVPYVAVLFSSLFNLVAYLAVNQTSVSNFQVFTQFTSILISIVWCVMNVSFLRFFYALKERTDIISRDNPAYPYKSPMQPYLAIYGLLGSVFLILFMGFTNFLHKEWSTRNFFSSYCSLIFFSALYFSYFLFGSSKIANLSQLDLDSGRREMDMVIWNENKEYNDDFKERILRKLKVFK